MVCKHAQYIYIYTYIHTYCTRCLRFPIPFVEDNGERTNGWTADRASNDTASSINFHLFFRLVNLNTVTKIRLDIYADISRPVYIRSNGSRAPRILKEKKKIGRILYFIPPTTSFISATDYYYVTRTISVAREVILLAGSGSVSATWPRDRRRHRNDHIVSKDGRWPNTGGHYTARKLTVTRV